eukprot:6471079-Amphidinium_carterae.1
MLNDLISEAASDKIEEDAELSMKGYNCGALHKDELSAQAFIDTKREVGIAIRADKLHLERGMLEMERCAVTEAGFKASLPRKVAAVVYAEPQGSTDLSKREIVSVAYESAEDPGGAAPLRDHKSSNRVTTHGS